VFQPGGPTLRELFKQALSSTKVGYDLLGEKFDRTPFPTPPAVLNLAVEHLRREGEYGRALDLCTGTGAAIGALLPIVKEEIVGVDWSEPMLAVAKKKYERAASDWPVVSLARADVLALPYKNEFDLATCFGALGHIERSRQREFIDAVHLSLKPGGIFAFAASEAPSLLSLEFWAYLGFDWLIRVRNILIKPPFIMYYLNFLLPGALNSFDRKKWAMIRLTPLDICVKPSGVCLVTAVKV